MIKNISKWIIFCILLVISFLLASSGSHYAPLLFSILFGYGSYIFYFKDYYPPWALIGAILIVVGVFVMIVVGTLWVRALIIIIVIFYIFKAPKKN